MQSRYQHGARYLYTTEQAVTSACVYGQITAPSAITLASFTAAAQSDDQVTWDTASELDNAGFNLYRDTTPGSIGVKLNDALIPSQGPNSPEGSRTASSIRRTWCPARPTTTCWKTSA